MSPSEAASIFRILDACRNRACEGLRVIEEISRMHLEDVWLTSQLKQARHDLSETLSRVLSDRQIVTRDSQTDIGRSIGTQQEYKRGQDDTSLVHQSGSPESNSTSLLPVAIANFKRVQQSLRSIEEFTKTDLIGRMEPELAKSVEQFRFRSYELEKTCLTLLNAADCFPAPSIYVLLPGLDWSSVCPAEEDRAPTAAANSQFAATVEALCVAEVDFIQLRDKHLSDRQLIAAARLARQTIGQRSTRLIVNDRPDIALTVGADGVHVGQDEMRVNDVRKLTGAGMLIGVSTHSIAQAEAAIEQGADYIGIGPVFPSQTKAFDSQVGTELVEQVCSQFSIPAFAIGGIDLENAAQVAQAGCRRIAVSGIYQRLVGQPVEAFIETTKQLKSALSQDTV